MHLLESKLTFNLNSNIFYWKEFKRKIILKLRTEILPLGSVDSLFLYSDLFFCVHFFQKGWFCNILHTETFCFPKESCFSAGLLSPSWLWAAAPRSLCYFLEDRASGPGLSCCILPASWDGECGTGSSPRGLFWLLSFVSVHTVGALLPLPAFRSCCWGSSPSCWTWFEAQLKVLLGLVSFPCENPAAGSFSLCFYFWWLSPTTGLCSSVCSSLTQCNAAEPTGAWKEQSLVCFFLFEFVWFFFGCLGLLGFFWQRPHSFTQAERLSVLFWLLLFKKAFSIHPWLSCGASLPLRSEERVHFAHLPFCFA